MGEIKNIVYYAMGEASFYMKAKEMKKSNYTEEEKQIVLENLNKERLIHQNAMKGLDNKKANYTEEEKKRILAKLNEERIAKKQAEENRKKRTHNKEKYTIGAKEYYKFLNMKREYFIEVSECEKITTRGAVIPLYYRNFSGLQKQNMLIKIEPFMDKFYISEDLIRIYYRTYVLEDKKD